MQCTHLAFRDENRLVPRCPQCYRYRHSDTCFSVLRYHTPENTLCWLRAQTGTSQGHPHCQRAVAWRNQCCCTIDRFLADSTKERGEHSRARPSECNQRIGITSFAVPRLPSHIIYAYSGTRPTKCTTSALLSIHRHDTVGSSRL